MTRLPSARTRTTAWLLAGVLFYAGGLGHWLHPCLHDAQHQHHQAFQSWQGAAPAQPRHHCPFCAFLAHFQAHQARTAWPNRLGPIHAARLPGLVTRLVPTSLLALPGCRAPPCPAPTLRSIFL